MKAELNQEVEFNPEAIDNKVFSKAVKVNAVALSAVKSFLEVSKVLGVHRSTIISWRNNISLTDYNKYNQTHWYHLCFSLTCCVSYFCLFLFFYVTFTICIQKLHKFFNTFPQCFSGIGVSHQTSLRCIVYGYPVGYNITFLGNSLLF